MVNLHHKKIIISDMDGTLAPSKCPPNPDMIELIQQFIMQHTLAVISGASLELFIDRFLSHLKLTNDTEQHILLLPTSGAAMYSIKDGVPVKIYAELLSNIEIELITLTIQNAVKQFHFPIPTLYGPEIENRGSAVTYSALGQNAPLSEKSIWDPERTKLKQLLSVLQPQLPDFHIAIGGMTSLDITRAGIDKAYGVKKIVEHTKLPLEQMMYIGDAIYPGGNDFAVTKTAIDYKLVSSLDETKQLFLQLLTL